MARERDEAVLKAKTLETEKTEMSNKLRQVMLNLLWCRSFLKQNNASAALWCYIAYASVSQKQTFIHQDLSYHFTKNSRISFSVWWLGTKESWKCQSWWNFWRRKVSKKTFLRGFFTQGQKIDVFIFIVWKLKDKYRKSSLTCLSPDVLSVDGKDFSCKHQVFL